MERHDTSVMVDAVPPPLHLAIGADWIEQVRRGDRLSEEPFNTQTDQGV